MSKKAFIFDLDGVIVDTAKYHYLAWRELANQLGFDFTKNKMKVKRSEPCPFFRDSSRHWKSTS